jgi:ribose/xylose/arabinose/galactoside ABC-type transport system permease subunit
LVLAAFHGGLAAVRWAMTGGRRGAVPITMILLVALVPAAWWVLRRRRAGRS